MCVRPASFLNVTPAIAFASLSSLRYGSALLLDLCRVTAYTMIAAAKITTTAAVAIRVQGVCFWLTIDLPGFLAGGRFAGVDLRGGVLRDADVVDGLRWAMGLPSGHGLTEIAPSVGCRR